MLLLYYSTVYERYLFAQEVITYNGLCAEAAVKHSQPILQIHACINWYMGPNNHQQLVKITEW